jgi:hypothetical protein
MKMNPVGLELPDVTKTLIFNYCLRAVGWMAKFCSLKDLYASIKM